jgi:DNA (cytosine-5)-methyltransferase 1
VASVTEATVSTSDAQERYPADYPAPRPRLLDLFCGAGGAAMGYSRAGFEVVGVDIKPQPRYPFEFHQADAMTFPLDGFDAIHASPPCQRFSKAQRLQGNEHPDLITPIRERLMASGLPWAIENVEDARWAMREPLTLLCGAAFAGLQVYRHRLFETSHPMPLVLHAGHGVRLTKLGHRPVDGEFMHVVGHFSGVARGRAAMGIDWPMTQDEVREAIPPAYTEWIGRQLMAHLQAVAA